MKGVGGNSTCQMVLPSKMGWTLKSVVSPFSAAFKPPKGRQTICGERLDWEQGPLFGLLGFEDFKEPVLKVYFEGSKS